jgi:3-hydroxybutyryl-CoA dehydratase
MNARDIRVGDRASFSKTIGEHDVYTFAGLSGDFNPVHVDAEYAKTTRFGERIAHGMVAACLFSNVLGNQLPGPGTVYLGQELTFKAPVKFGDTITATCEVIAKREDKPIVTLRTTATNQRGDVVIEGRAVVKAPG